MVRRVCVFFLLLSFLLAPYIAESAQQNDTSSISDQEEMIDGELESTEIEESDSEEQFEADNSSDLVLFIGRFHPFFVHLPIGFLLFAFVLECASLFKRFEQLKPAVPFALFMGILSGIVAGITGYLLSLGGGYDEELIVSHKWLGIGVVFFSSVALFIRIAYYDNLWLKKVFRFILVVLTGIVMATGHLGGSLTHGPDYLFRYMPEPLLLWTDVDLEEEEQISLIEDLDSAKVYDDIINPIIRTRCESCHNPDRTEGELLLTSFDQIMSGGESGSVIEKNHAEGSELYKRLTLPARDEDRMPPRGRRQLTHDQIKLIAWWIDEGVPTSDMVSEIEIPDEISDILHKLTEEGQSFFERTEVPVADEGLFEEVEEQGFRISQIAEDMNFLQVRVSKSKSDISREDIEFLLPLSEQITWLDLSSISISDTDLTQLSEFQNLTKLELEQTDIADSTLKKIGSLENLEHLNVHSTDISDEGLQYLEKNKSLKSLYIWQTKISDTAVENLQEQLPQTNVVKGWNREDLTASNED